MESAKTPYFSVIDKKGDKGFKSLDKRFRDTGPLTDHTGLLSMKKWGYNPR